MQPTLTHEEDLAVQQTLDERADHIPVDQLKVGTATGDFFDSIHKSLVARGTKLLVGPRGCGKTHMMRYTWLLCRDESNLPLAIYVSFNRYYRLEPLLKSRSNATDLFHVWVLARILQALAFLLGQENLALSGTSRGEIIGVEVADLDGLVGRLERGVPLTEQDEEVASVLNIEYVVSAIEHACQATGSKRAVVLMDDAALTLTPEYLIEFFDVVRVLRRPGIAPKASVYPATDFGPRFHATHEAELVPVWLSVDAPEYSDIMGAIAQQRLSGLNLPPDVDELLKYAAFGVPRAYLTMIREYSRGSGTQQQITNKVIEDHSGARREEYESMALKMPRFDTLVKTGAHLFDAMIKELKEAQGAVIARGEKQIMVGVPASEISGAPLVERMFSLLVEAGLLFEHQTVSHGEGRIYRRYTPHLASLISARGFSGNSRGTSARQTVEALRRRSVKHPLRRVIRKLIKDEQIQGLRIDLPPCRVCNEPRMTDQQRFCHHCGSQLLDDSTFTRCMSLPLTAVPGLTRWQRSKIASLDRIRTIGDLLAIQDPGTELRKLHRVGTVRASRILEMVTSFVDEFLS